jgi:hypothetical protein
LRLSWRRSTERCGCSAPRWLEKPPLAANACGSWAGRPTTASTPTTLTHLHGQVRSSSPPRRCCEQCRHPRPLRRGTCNARCRLSLSKRLSSRPKAQPHISASRGMHEETGLHRGANPQSTQVKLRGAPPTRDARRPWSGSLTRAGRWTVTLATSSMPTARAGRMPERR